VSTNLFTRAARRWRRTALLALSMAVPIAVAGAAAGPARAAEPGALVLGVQLEPPVLDPTSNPAAVISELLHGNLYEGLVRFNAAGEPQPCLAERWTLSPDGLTYTFSLRRGVSFHDGSPFDSQSAKFTLERALAPGSLNPHRARLAAVQSIEAPDPHTLVLRLSRRSGSLLQSLAWTAFAMLSPASAADNALHPVGTGPFKFAGWRRGDSLELLRNDSYWDGAPAIARLRFKFIAEPAAAYAALMAGDIQVFANYPAPESVAQFQRDPRFAVHVGSTEGEVILALNNRRPPLDDRDVRRAIAHAVDRAAIIDGAMFGFGEPIGSHFPPRSPAAIDLTGRYAHSLQESQRLLAAAGRSAGFPLTLKLPPTAYARRGGEVIAAQLRAVGLDARIENIEWAQWLDQVFARHDFDATVIQHAEPMDYDIYGREDYYFGYVSADLQALLAKLEDQIDPAARRATLGDIQRRITEDAPNVFLFQYPKLSVYDRRVSGLILDDPLNATYLGRARFAPAAATATTAPAATAAERQTLVWLTVVVLAALAWKSLGWKPLLRRMGILVTTLLAASAVIFAIVQIAPGDPARFMLGLQADPALVAAVRHELGLDVPLLHRYLHWVAGMLGGDFGLSYTYRVPVAALIAERLSVSLPLASYALLLTLLIAFPLGILAAAQRGRAADPWISSFTQLGVAIPSFWLGILLILVFAVTLRWVSAGGFPGWDAGWWNAMRALTLPAIALALPQAAILARVLRAALLETLHEDYVRTARAKGLTPSATLLKHALPNAMLPVLTVLGLQLSFLLAGAIVVENVFFLPGLGRLVFQAIVQRDLIVVQGVVLLLVAAIVAVSFLTDLAYAWMDPRLRKDRA
jgi:ABC-type dipeptide/oligopeptide/nickel transport system permease component/ABC-type transport system substrate-binding protein